MKRRPDPLLGIEYVVAVVLAAAWICGLLLRLGMIG